MKLLKNVILTIIIQAVFFSVSTLAKESSASFVVTSFGSHYKVLGPSRLVGLSKITKSRTVGVIIENKTLSTLKGKIETSRGEVLVHISVKARSNESYDLRLKSNTRYFFVPLSPAFQKVELKIGKEAYEIPEKR